MRQRQIGKAEQGFTLLEVLVATVIMGIAVAGLIAGLSQSAKNASRLSDYDRAAMLARGRMNELLLDANLPFEGNIEGLFTGDQSGAIPTGWRATLKPFDAPPKAGPGAIILQRVALEVWWMPPNGGRRSIQLEGFRQAMIPIPVSR
jgi:prepilin-type N-terminal cleavage/methylation domain-containing protein